MKLAIAGETLGSVKSLTEILEILKKIGVNAIEIWPENIPVEAGKELVHKRLYANRDIQKAKEIISAKGMEVACVCFGAGFDEQLAKDKELFSQELERAVYVAKELGAKVVNHYCYFVSLNTEYEPDKLRSYYEKAIKAAKRCEIYLALENEAHDITKDPVQMLQIVKDMNSDYFKTTYDATNYYQAGIEGFPYAYEILKEEIVHVHIKNGCLYRPEHGHCTDSMGGKMTGVFAGNNVYYPVASDGAVNVDGLLRRLVHDGYKGYCSLEPHTTIQLCEAYYAAETGYLYSRGFFEASF